MAINRTRSFADAGGTVGTTVLTLADIFTGVDLSLASRAWITVTTNDILYRYTGSDPAAGSGHVLKAGGATEIIGNWNVTNLKIIRSGGSDAVYWITLEG